MSLCKGVDYVAVGTMVGSHESFSGREYLFSVDDFIKQQEEHFIKYFKNKSPIKSKKDFFEKMTKI